MAESVATPESVGAECSRFGRCAWFFGLVIGSVLTTIIGACIYTVKPDGLILVVVGDSFQMNTSLQGNVTLRFTLRAENPTSCSISYNNISGTIAVRNEYGENKDHLLRFTVADFDVQQQTSVESPTQVTATKLNITEKSTSLLLQLNGTIETSSRNSSAGYRCRISTSEYDKACARVKEPTV